MATRQLPEITTSLGDVLVDNIKYRRDWLGVSSRGKWHIYWRSKASPRLKGKTRLSPEAGHGRAKLGGKDFTFSVRWRADLRRPLLFAPQHDSTAPAQRQHLVES